MTLCIAWRAQGTIHMASDSRLSFGSAGTTDCAIKVARTPFRITGPSEEGKLLETLAEGDIGLCFAGSAVAALMAKETIAEVIYTTQGIPMFHRPDMDGIADLVFKSYKIVTAELAVALQQGAATCIVFAGYCPTQQRLRAFRVETSPANEMTILEVLKAEGDREVFGSGALSANRLLPDTATTNDIIATLQKVIDDPGEKGVGGSIQYGYFEGARFQPMGVAKLEYDLDGSANVHYWRAALDLNDPDFQAAALFPNLPLLNLIPR